MKKSDNGFDGFGEAYFSTVNMGQIKGWKRHLEMTLNLIVIIGEVEFVLYNGEKFYKIILSKKNYQRLTIRPGLWLAFTGLENENTLLNLASIEHSPKESETVDIGTFKYNWVGLGNALISSDP